MATSYTQYYNLGKQTDHSDKFSMSVITDNMDKIDTALHDITPTEAQLDAMNSGITPERVGELEGIDTTGDNFIEINGVKLYFGSTAPSNPSDGDWWLD